MDCLGNGCEESRESKDTNIDHILAASLFGFNSTTVQPPISLLSVNHPAQCPPEIW